jgi:hypothetical protein
MSFESFANLLANQVGKLTSQSFLYVVDADNEPLLW